MANVSVLIVTNLGVNPITIAGETIAPQGNYSYPYGSIETVCQDFNFNMGLMLGSVQANFNGFIFSLEQLSDALMNFLYEVGQGNINLP
jgi:hypothetical protein